MCPRVPNLLCSPLRCPPRYPHSRIALLLTILLPILAVLAGCPSPSVPPAPPPPSPDLTIGVQPIAEGLTSPIAMAVPNDNSNRKFIVDQVGKVYIINGSNNLLPTPFLDLSDRLVPLKPDYDERGLLGLAFHPDFATNGRFFVMYSAPKGPTVPPEFDSELHVSEFTLAFPGSNQAVLDNERILLVIPKPQFNHNGGTLLFGSDGFLYISVGDGGGANDDNIIGHTPGLGNAQDISKLLGKILRIDVNTATPYAIPADNPFVGNPNARPEIWALGLRNPYRMSFDRGDPNRLFVGDAGQDLYEEVDIITRGGNYGWNIREGSHCFDPNNPLTPPATCPTVDADSIPLTNPILEYLHISNLIPFGTVVVGGYVYRGAAIPDLQGRYIFGDLTRNFPLAEGIVFVATENTEGTWTFDQLPVADRTDGQLGEYIKSFGEDAQGELYILTSSIIGPSGTTGKVYRIVPAP